MGQSGTDPLSHSIVTKGTIIGFINALAENPTQLEVAPTFVISLLMMHAS